jgi:uncharacterized protein (TIGR02284 family)
MKTKDQVLEVLNDLVRINNDRIEGYTTATKELKTEDADLQSLFSRMKSESQQLKSQLENKIAEVGGESDKDSTLLSGKIYRVWMDVKASFSGKDRKSILSSCEFGEDAAQKAYAMALKEEDLPSEIRDLISAQKAQLRKSHDEVKMLRDTSRKLEPVQ